MPITTTTTVTRSSGVAVHTISFRGLAGAIFICLALASVLYVIGFVTTEWSIYRGWHEGLWESCQCGQNARSPDWFRAVQGMMAIGLIGLIVCMVLACIYLCIHSVSKNTTILALVIVSFISVLFMVIGFLIYGTKRDGLNWSFAVSVIASIFTFIAGVLAIVQMRKAGVTV